MSNDLISKSKLLEDFRNTITENSDTFDWLNMINRQPQSDGWIPADKPPKNDNYILLSFANFSVPQVGRYEEDETGGAYYVGDDIESCISQDIIVNAWMPLPEPYKEV